MDSLVFNTRTAERGTPRRATRVIRRFWVFITAPSENRGHGGTCRIKGPVLAVLEPRLPTAADARPRLNRVVASDLITRLQSSIVETR